MKSEHLRHEVVIDAGPLIALARLNLLHLPGTVFAQSSTTDSVIRECTANPEFSEAKAKPIAEAVESGLITRFDDPSSNSASYLNLGPGEASVLQLASQRKRAVLVDDRAARRWAERAGIDSIGTCGVLILARRSGAIGALAPILDALLRSGYFLGPNVMAAALEMVGET